MATVERTGSIDAPLEKVFAYLSDPMSQLEWLPSMVEVTEVKRTEEGVGSTFRWKYKMVGITFEGSNETLEYVPNKRMVLQSRGGIDSTWTWTYQPEGGGTKLNLHIEYAVPVPVLGRIAEALVLGQNQREADLAMANIKSKMEG